MPRPAFVACLLALGCAGAGAANLQISPVSITFRAGQGASGITLQNQGDTPVYGQVRAYAWTQRDGEDVLGETAELVASPPIIEIAPRAAQTIRLILKAGSPTAVERSFRLLIDELPRADGTQSGVDIRLRYSVPVFVPPAGDAAPVLAWRVFRQGGEWMLRVANTGAQHAQLGSTTLRNGAGTEIIVSKGLLGYVLPGQERSWKLPVAQDAQLDGKVAVRSVVNARPETADTAGR
ncbi:fimbrial biogenesis chaperone [Pseudoduganella lutea]|uniref:Molecular chaperone n=1 Tax=Pseudoduganella lutea TaxID=321985 RepID=A0A4P6L3D5_9BURK|nr:fimbria/pilus periplasmic chaperone [Pseudoduganella lutea]QBE66146.1 molecular chaperone [Pseudoduganella lutea]